MSRRAKIVAGCVGVGIACMPIPERTSPSEPVNACPDHPCAAYVSPSPSLPPPDCIAGTCALPTTGTHGPGDLAVLVALPEDSYLAPDRTFAFQLADLLKTSTMRSSCKCAPNCVCLPTTFWLVKDGQYYIPRSEADKVGFSLGPPEIAAISLPVHVTYRALWPPPSPPSDRADAAAPQGDAIHAGLPVYPVEAQVVTIPFGFPSGPGQGPSLGFRTYLQSEMSYERVIAPDPPFDRVFPPDVNTVHEPEATEVVRFVPEPTIEKPAGTTIPTFDLMRTDKPLDGWTAYLRDATTKRAVSPIAPLAGIAACGVLLPTSHHPSPSDALTNTELVMAPPAAEAVPKQVFSPPGILRQDVYPILPEPVRLNGKIVWPVGTPPAATATVVFEATAVYAARLPSVPDPCDGGVGGSPTDGGAPDAGVTFELYPSGFEFVARATAQPDLVAGTSTYQVTLPRGEYRAILRPQDAPSLDASAGPVREVTIVDGFDTHLDGPVSAPAIAVHLATVVTGKATVADGRALSGATVNAVPVQCPKSMVVDGGLVPMDSAECMPRAAQTRTHSDGVFSLALDRGRYALRVEPADGTRLPWVVQDVWVPGPTELAFSIPAPIHYELQLSDPGGNYPIANALVRVFRPPAQGSPAVEVWSTMTDVHGHFDVYLDPTTPP